MAILLTMLSTACQSTKVITVEKVIVPIIDFPDFPLAETMKNNKDGTVTVPATWILRMEEYHIRINETEKNYTSLKSLYESKDLTVKKTEGDKNE